MKSEWFASWFDTPYYHILYKNRDYQEASQFIDALIDYLKPAPQSKILDLACGKGRHSIHLEKMGFDLTGVDLSIESIRHAQKYETEHLSFFTHDVRDPFRTNYFDYIFNFFTSFGYFEKDHDHFRTVKNIALGLKPNGIFVIDFLNAPKAIAELKKEEEKVIDGIHFKLKRQYENGFITKSINFDADGQSFHFEEKVRGYTKEDFLKFFDRLDLKLLKVFGDYQLSDYDPNRSPRLILVAQK